MLIPKRSDARRTLLLLSLLGCLSVLCYQRFENDERPTVASLGAEPALEPIILPPAQHASIASIAEVVVGRNDTMDAIFRRLSLNLSDLAAIRNLPGIRQSLDYLKPGDSIKLTHASSGDIQELSRKVSETKTLDVVRENDGFSAKMIENPVETRVRVASATIDSSLFQAAEGANVSDTVALKLAGVFAWDIDFVLDIRQGDRFTAEYEQIYQDGKYLRDGEVLAAEFVNNGHVYRAVRYVSDGHVGYYTPTGRPMRKAFLRAPVDFTRVSSAFNPHRLHPILDTIRGHMGTDYAAPTGTPVHAAGDGRVSFAGKKGGYGNCLVIAHGNGISTLYGHLSRFAQSARIGSKVDQGQVVAYVGMTGLATGPHLHYEYLVNGVHKNPQTVQLPGAEPLRAQLMNEFLSTSAPLLAALTPAEAPQTPPNAASAGLSPSAGQRVAGAAQ